MISSGKAPSIGSRPLRRMGWLLGGAAFFVWLLLLGIRFTQSAPTWAAPSVRPPQRGQSLREQAMLAPPPKIQFANAPVAAAALSVDEEAGRKAVEPRVPLDEPPQSAESDPGPGPHMQFYGGRSGRLSSHAVARVSHETAKSVSNGKGGPTLVIWATKSRVTIGQPVTIRAIVADASGHLVEPERISIVVAPSGHAVDASSSPMPPAPDKDVSQFAYTTTLDAADPSPAPGSGTATPPGPSLASKPLTNPRAPPQEYEFVVRATGAENGTPFDKTAGGYVLLQYATARLDPTSISVDFVRGNLELSLGLQVEGTGNYMASAELWAGPKGDKPVAFARLRLEGLSVGTQRVPLLFGGRVIRDSALDGPYTVRNIQLMQVDSIPPHGADPIEELPKTRAFQATDFY